MMIRNDMRGFTLIELVIVIIILAIVAGVAMRQLQPSIESARVEQTKAEMQHLAWAIAGNPELRANGARSDFGYVGDIGALPPNLDALVHNPGGLATWQGPYIDTGFNATDFLRDGWQQPYVLADTVIRSSGSGSNIDKAFAPSSAALLTNTVAGVIRNADGSAPGAGYRDSLLVRLFYPDGSGGIAIAATTLTAQGAFSMTNVPIGNHPLQVIYLPENDTVGQYVCVLPGRTAALDIVFPADMW